MRGKLKIWTHGSYPILAGMFLALATLAVGIVYAASGGVDQNGLFELDGDATYHNATSPYGPFDDWQNLVSNSPAPNASLQQFTGVTPDPGHGTGTNVSDQTTFIGGGSKDINDISKWKWTAGSIPAKDDITNAYAAAYTNPSNQHLIVYFGADRFANNGSAQMGFWFLKNKIPDTLPADGTFGTTHQVGDLLVLANFSGKAVLTGFEVLEWVGTGGDQKGGTLQTEIAPETAACGTSAADINGCATSNSTDIPLYWSYTAKFPTSPVPSQCSGSGVLGCAPVASFFEGGIDVTGLLNETPCLGTFLVETRSSSGSVTAQLEDFVYHSFSLCGFTVNKTCGGGTQDGAYVQNTFGGVVTNSHGVLTDVTVTDTFPSDAVNIDPAGSGSGNVRSYDIGTINADLCQTWPVPRSGYENVGFPCSDLSINGGSFTPNFSANTYDTQMNGADNMVTNATAIGGTVIGTQDDKSPLPLTASCPAAPGPSLTAAKTCSVSVSSSLVISVGASGSVCNESGFLITNLAGSDIQTKSDYTPLSGANSNTLIFKDNSNVTTYQLQPCPDGNCTTSNQGDTDKANTCATFTDSYTPTQASGGTNACTDVFSDKVSVSGNYLGGTDDTNKVSQEATHTCPLCGCN